MTAEFAWWAVLSETFFTLAKPSPLRRPAPPQLDPRRVSRGDGGGGVGAGVGAVRGGYGGLRLDAGRRGASHPGQAIGGAAELARRRALGLVAN